MPLPGHIEVSATTHWDGQRVSAYQVLPAQAWADEMISDQVKRSLRYRLAEAIAERLDVTFTETERRY